MKIPTITHVQFAVLVSIKGQVKKGEDVRDYLSSVGIDFSAAPAFYQLMKRLEKSGYVKGHYREHMKGNQRIRERFYETTEKGNDATLEVHEFYTQEKLRII